MYKAWVDPEALTAYDVIGDGSKDNADSLFVEGNELFITDENLVFGNIVFT